MNSYCIKCNKNVEYSIIENKIDKFKGININIIEYIGICNECGEKLYINELEDENTKKICFKYRGKTGMVTPEEINRFKIEFNLTNSELALITGCTEVVLDCIDDTYLQSKEDDNRLRKVIRNKNNLENIVKERMELRFIDSETYKKILLKIKNR